VLRVEIGPGIVKIVRSGKSKAAEPPGKKLLVAVSRAPRRAGISGPGWLDLRKSAARHTSTARIVRSDPKQGCLTGNRGSRGKKTKRMKRIWPLVRPFAGP